MTRVSRSESFGGRPVTAFVRWLTPFHNPIHLLVSPMQTVLQVACSNGKSLRDAIAGDTKLAEHGLTIVAERKVGRSPGWTKIRSGDGSCHGRSLQK